MVRILLKIAAGALVAIIAAVAAVPLLVLRDLTSGGDGWGICPGGLDQCKVSYFAGFELIMWLAIILMMAMVLLRAVTRSRRWAEHRYDRTRAARARFAPKPPIPPPAGRVGEQAPGPRPGVSAPAGPTRDLRNRVG